MSWAYIAQSFIFIYFFIFKQKHNLEQEFYNKKTLVRFKSLVLGAQDVAMLKSLPLDVAHTVIYHEEVRVSKAS